MLKLCFIYPNYHETISIIRKNPHNFNSFKRYTISNQACSLIKNFHKLGFVTDKLSSVLWTIAKSVTNRTKNRISFLWYLVRKHKPFTVLLYYKNVCYDKADDSHCSASFVFLLQCSCGLVLFGFIELLNVRLWDCDKHK